MKPIVNAGFEAAVPKENQYDKTFHHSPGSLTSALGASHMMWRPRGTGSLLDANMVVQNPMKETPIGSLKIQIHTLVEPPQDLNNAYVRLGCLLPCGAQSGRWPRYHTKYKTQRNSTDIIWNEGIRVGIVEYEENENDEKIIMYPQITLSIRRKKGGWFGSSTTLTKICTIAFDKLWNGPTNAWSSPLNIPLPAKSQFQNPLNLCIFMKYEPKPKKEVNPKECREIEDLCRDLALLSTYKNKVLMTPLKQDQIEIFQENEDEILHLQEDVQDPPDEVL